MRDYEKDYWDLDFYKGDHHNYTRIYRNTNEQLKEIFRNFDFQDKNVLSVMGSSDQPFSAYYLGAESVDTFDLEYLTYYYFYLRKWIIEIYNQSIIYITPKLIYECIELATGEEEENVASFFKLLAKKFSAEDIQGLFYPQSYEWNTPFDGDEKKLASIIKDKKANFHQWDLFKEIKHDKKYSIIILSNMLEYITYDNELKKRAAQNLDNLLSPDGIIISSNLRGYKYAYRKEFNKYFEYIEGEKFYHENFEKEVPLYYTYRRK